MPTNASAYPRYSRYFSYSRYSRYSTVPPSRGGRRRLPGLAAIAGVLAAVVSLPAGAGVAATGPAALAAPVSPVVARSDPGSALVEGRRPLPADVPAATGTVARVVADSMSATPAQSDGGVLTYVVTEAGSVQVPANDLAGVPTGARVRVRLGRHVPASGSAPSRRALTGRRASGVELLDVPAVPAPGDTAPNDTSAPGARAGAAAARAAYAHSVTMVLVVPAGGATDSMTTSSFRTWLEGTSGPFWSGESGGAITLSVASVKGWTTSSYACTSSSALNLFADVAKKVGFVAGTGKHLAMYIAPTSGTASCGAGLGTVGSGPNSGGSLFVRGSQKSLLTHELGHNLSLLHSSALRCPASQDGGYNVSSRLWANGCAVASYYDMYDVMGFSWPSTGSLNTLHASRLGLLGSGRVATVSGSSRAVLLPVSGRTGLVSLRVNDPSGVVYVVEYRTASGRDAFLAANPYGVKPGVLVRRADPASAAQSLLLDATPSAGDYVVPIGVGSKITTASGRMTITTEAATASSAKVAVRLDGVAPAAVPAR